VSGATVYAGGAFTTIGGQPRYFIAALDANGIATNWNPNADDWVNTIAVSGDTVYAGGYFTAIGSPTQNIGYLVALDSSANVLQDTTWEQLGAYGTVNTLVASGSSLYVGGSFTSIGKEPLSYFGQLSTIP
jgi:hypothetical protein